MTAPKVSVVMPVYNAERFVKDAIESILNQTLCDFEFIIIDDGSTDNTQSIIADFADQRILFVRNGKNLGISPTLNRGIDLAKSELIARMDADDISHPSRLKKQFDYMIAHKECALLSTWANVVTEDQKFVRLERYRSNFYYYNLTFECWIYHPTVMYRKKSIEEVGMYSMAYSEDFDLFWKVSRNFRIANLPEALLDYRLSSTSLNGVLRKQEYEIANEQNVKRNLQYYLGPMEIPHAVLECLRHNFKPIAKEQKTEDLEMAMDLLKRVTEKILITENPNRSEEDIRTAYYFKRKFIMDEVSKILPKHKMLELLIRTRDWRSFNSLMAHGIQWRMKNIMASFSVE